MNAIHFLAFVLLMFVAWFIPLGALSFWVKAIIRILFSIIALASTFAFAELLFRIMGKAGAVLSLSCKLRRLKEGREMWETGYALAKIGTPSAVRHLVNACKDVSVELADAIGNVRNPRATSVLMSTVLMRDIAWQVRIHAIDALGNMNDKKAIDVLQQVLNDEDVGMRAASVITKLGGVPRKTQIPRNDIHNCAKDGDEWNIQRLIAADRSWVHKRDGMRRTPLHYAARAGHVDLVELLLKNGADKNARDEYRYSPLHMAAETNRPEVIRKLLDHGVDLTVRCSARRTPLHHAVMNNALDAMKVLLKDAGATMLPATDDEGMTAKRLAEKMGHTEAIGLIQGYE